MRQPWWFWWLGISALLVCVGSFGPWASVLFISVSGLQGDGKFTLLVGVAALVVFGIYVKSRRRPRPAWLLALLVAGGLGAGITGAYYWVDIQTAISGADLKDNPFAATVSVDWGLMMLTIAGFSLALAAAITFTRRTLEPAPLPAPASTSIATQEEPLSSVPPAILGEER